MQRSLLLTFAFDQPITKVEKKCSFLQRLVSK